MYTHIDTFIIIVQLGIQMIWNWYFACLCDTSLATHDLILGFLKLKIWKRKFKNGIASDHVHQIFTPCFDMLPLSRNRCQKFV